MCDQCLTFRGNVERLRVLRVLVRLRARELGEAHKIETALQVEFADSELKKAEDAYRRSEQGHSEAQR